MQGVRGFCSLGYLLKHNGCLIYLVLEQRQALLGVVRGEELVKRRAARCENERRAAGVKSTMGVP